MMSSTTPDSEQEDGFFNLLVEAIDDRRFDADYAGGLHANNQYVVKLLMPLIKAECLRTAKEARIDELQRLSTRRQHGMDYQDSLDALDDYKDQRIATLQDNTDKVLEREDI
jgi:hypothetical protein